MRALEALLGLALAAVVLASVARRVGAPYPVFLALGGALLAFVPGAPGLTVPPDLALALFLAPVLLDAAYDASRPARQLGPAREPGRLRCRAHDGGGGRGHAPAPSRHALGAGDRARRRRRAARRRGRHRGAALAAAAAPDPDHSRRREPAQR